MKNPISHYDTILATIERTTEYDDIKLAGIANNGPSNTLNIDLSESENEKLQNIAKQKIRDLEKSAY